jgi:hypothetical protein
MLSRLKFEIDHVIDIMLSELPEEVWKSDSTTFFDPSMGGGQIVNAIEKKLKEHGHSDKNIAQRVAGSELNTMRINYAVNKNKLLGSYTSNIDESKTYDVIVSLPMFNISSEGGQNKVYNQYSKTSLNMLSNNGTLLFVTPVSVLKKSKRFSLRGQPNLKLIDFTIGKRELLNKKDICFWVIDKTFNGKVTVRDNNGESLQDNTSIVDYSVHDKEFVKLYHALKQATDKPEKRMFKQNNFGPAMAKQESEEHRYPLYKINKEGEKEITFWSSRKPYDYQKTKFTICMTKALQNSIYVSKEDFDLAYMTKEASESEIESIKSFIATEYFVEHSTKWKKLDGYGYNYALKYLPPFDTKKKWNNESVKQFLESFLVDKSAS